MSGRKPGRPAIGPQVNVRIPPDLLSVVDDVASMYAESRSDAIRRLLRVSVTYSDTWLPALETPPDTL